MITLPDSEPFDFGVKTMSRMQLAYGFNVSPLAHVVPLASVNMPETI